MTTKTVLAALVLFPFRCAAQDGAPPKRYPWDMRPSKCFMDPKEFPAILTSPECKNRDWLYFEESKRNFGSLMGAQPNYELLDRAANEIGFSRDRFKTGEYLFEAAYMHLDLGLQAVTQHHPEFGSIFVEQWLRAKGNEGYAQLAQALLQYHQAWHARSNGAASTVTPEGWKLFYAKLDEARNRSCSPGK